MISTDRILVRSAGAFVLTLLMASTGHAQQFVENQSDIPSGSTNNGGLSENIDFADVDLDGDWDAAFANGGDNEQDQNRLWINMGGDQGGTKGVFDDQTAARFPSLADQSRDIEFVDIDNDGDVDIYVSNTSTDLPQANRWWVNTGVGDGMYVDETLARWVGLGGPGSSVPNAAVFPGGGFKDWSCDCDFGDLDNDGDLDLVHSSYGGNFGGDVPTRIFLNDGNGFFSEFNPGGFQLVGDEIQNGNPGLWCEGTQQANTTNATGASCDIASSALDIDLGDIDGDLDLDILHGARQEEPRMFANRLEENGGVLGFRDVTGSVFPAGYTSGDGHYEQEMGDLDGDGDLDIYGLNWLQSLSGFVDTVMENTGNGVFTDIQQLSNSGLDDNEGDFFDADNDGDLDLFVANFSGADKLYENTGPGAGHAFRLNFVSGAISASSFVTLDADACDVDGDGDYDLFTSTDNNSRNQYLENLDNTPDTHAPYFNKLEAATDRVVGAAPTVIRCQVYDNAPYYITWYNPTVLKVTVDGSPIADIPMQSSGGQIFRGEIPGTLVGMICYSVESRDEYGNTGISGQLCFSATSAGGPGVPFCFGVGCPCGNDDPTAGCANSTGAGASLGGSGSTSIASDDLVLTATNCPPNNSGLFFGADTPFTPPVLVGDGFGCAGGLSFRYLPGAVSPSGVFVKTNVSSTAATGFINPGDTRHFQAWTRDVLCGPPPSPCPSPCGNNNNLSNSYSVTFTP